MGYPAMPVTWPILLVFEKTDICPLMESKFGCFEQKIVVLQDHKRLPARFFACVCGALSSRRR
ncbi:hypothetical protein AX761_07550 [Rhizobium sp. 58]|nr:hypothetical protein AX761_07550 [Rhizobium sp. 58]